jgi:beta-glucosidase/6-phospho-beta-glucosidase/beta-galactosidase
MMHHERMATVPEVWGGIECSHVRVRDMQRDQIQETGHQWRLGDIDRVARLGLRVLRYPVLWPTVVRNGRYDFRWHDARFSRMQALGIKPIAGLLHHGCGPCGETSLTPGFAESFAKYAGKVAQHYPWIKRFTPINEPITTARFSALYGHWHPHLQSEAAFLQMVFHSAHATALAMQEIRRHTPDAKLIQNEDLGRTFSTPDLAYQADYENERRFLAFDLLAGRVRPGHRFWEPLLDAGVPRAPLDALASSPCPPDIIGVDYYLTSDRYLDHRIGLHPSEPVGGNGQHDYVDVAAVHLPDLLSQTGILHRLREVHDRYGGPIALTEVHNGCTRDEQVRWLYECWQAAIDARHSGIDVRAVTIWALFGSFDWNSLLRHRDGHYEAGAFDLRADPPRQTAVGDAVHALARTRNFAHPVLDQPGWWRPARKPQTPHLCVTGADEVAGPVVRHCARRRLTVTDCPKTARMGELRCSTKGDARFFELWQRAELVLSVTASPIVPVDNAIRTALDLTVDGMPGCFVLCWNHTIKAVRIVDVGSARKSGPREGEGRQIGVSQLPRVKSRRGHL